ncbi:MAG: hypothetical protein FJ276_14680 [Planctomycetes bacterium]|nr:hypothetical protein [Planctomycetota bacterium]
MTGTSSSTRAVDAIRPKATLQRHHLVAVVGGPHGFRQIGDGDAQRLGVFLHAKLVFPFAGPQVVLDVDGAVTVRQPLLALFHRLLQLAEALVVRPRKQDARPETQSGFAAAGLRIEV